MDTSVGARLAVCMLIFVAGMVVVYANFRLLAFLALRRPVSPRTKIIWPLLLVLMAFCIVDAVRLEPNWLRVTRHTIESSKLPSGSRIRIVQISDIHLESFGPREKRMIELTKRQKPDIIVLTGDQTYLDDPHVLGQLTKVTAQLADIAPVYAIEGNWDFAESMLAVHKGGAKLLSDWTVANTGGGARVAMCCLPWNGGSLSRPPKRADSLCRIVLCHMPEQFPAMARQKVDLMLAGHTHGGQVRLPIFGALLPDRRLVGRYQAGMYRIGDSRLYVSRGIGMEGGHAPRIRFWCRPELPVIDVTSLK